MASIEDQIAGLKQQVVEEGGSRAAAEKTGADRAKAHQHHHEETLKKQRVETMQMFARLMEKQSGQEEQKQRDEQVHEAPAAGDDVENPASPKLQDLHRAADSVVHVEVGPREDQSSERRTRSRLWSLRYVHGSRSSSIPTMKMAPPVLKEEKRFRPFSYRKLKCTRNNMVSRACCSLSCISM